MQVKQAMSETLTKLNFRIRSALKLTQSTTQIELQDKELKKEYTEFLAYEKSGEPERYRMLKELVTSTDFADRKKQINSQRFKHTDAYKKLLEYNSMKNSNEFRGYFRFINSSEYKEFEKLYKSKAIEEFEELERYLQSSAFNNIKKSTFKNSEAWHEYINYKKLIKTPEIRDYYKIVNSTYYRELNKPEISKKIAKFKELHEFVNSFEFAVFKKSNPASEFKKTPEYLRESEYKSMLRDLDVKKYLKLTSNRAYSNYKLLKNSPELAEFKKIEKFITSPEFEKARKKFEADKLIELQKLSKFNNLRKSAQYRAYYKMLRSKDLGFYNTLHESEELKKFRDLEEYVNSSEFREVKSYMELTDKFKKSDEYKQLVEYNILKKSAKLQWYNNLKESNRFALLEKWEEVFYDDFKGKSLNDENWLTSFYWSKELLNQPYSLSSDNHFYTEGKNISVNSSALKIISKKENITGLAWNQGIGFFPKDFKYTSGLINNGHSFRQKYGAFEAKIKTSSSPGVTHTFCLVSEKITPHIDVFKISGSDSGKIETNLYYSKNGDQEIIKHSDIISGVDPEKGYIIYRLEWYPDKLIWKINNCVIRESSKGVPGEPMYIMFSSGIENRGIEQAKLPATLDIDWVKCYRLNEKS